MIYKIFNVPLNYQVEFVPSSDDLHFRLLVMKVLCWSIAYVNDSVPDPDSALIGDALRVNLQEWDNTFIRRRRWDEYMNVHIVHD